MSKLGDVLSAIDKQRLDVLDPGETRRERLWKKCVFDAKELVENQKNIRFSIVDLAKKCCVIHLGGSVGTGNRYTLRAFAKEVGLPWGTFYEWYTIKENIYESLPDNEKETTTYSRMRFIEREMYGTKWREVTDKKKIVAKTLKDIKKKSATTIKMQKYLKHLKTVQFNAKNKLMIKDCDKELLGEICHVCRDIVNHLAKYDKK